MANNIMKKGLFIWLVGVIILLSGCAQKEGEKAWECRIAIEDNASEYVFASEEIQTKTGQLTLYHEEGIDIEYCLAYEDENGELVIVHEGVAKSQGAVVFTEGIEREHIYKVGVRAKEIDKTEVTIYVLEKHAKEPWN